MVAISVAGVNVPTKACILLTIVTCVRSRFATTFPLKIAVLLLLVIPASAQQLAKRLVLKDGSYQLATKYEVHGDRVHYLSAERNEWEDIPNSLIDWDATAKFEKDRAAGRPAPEALQLDKELAEERLAEEAKSPEVAPGLRLPEDGDIFLLDTFQTLPQLVQLQQSAGKINRDTKHNILRATVNPVASSKQTVELDGLHAKIQVHASLPSIYINFQRENGIEDSTAQKKEAVTGALEKQKPKEDDAWDRFHIVRLQSKKDTRIVGEIKVAVYGKVSQQETFVPAKIQQLTGGWVKMTPSDNLPPGEYALVEVIR